MELLAIEAHETAARRDVQVPVVSPREAANVRAREPVRRSVGADIVLVEWGQRLPLRLRDVRQCDAQECDDERGGESARLGDHGGCRGS